MSMKRFVLKIQLQSGEKQFNYTKLFSTESIASKTVAKEFLQSWDDNAELDGDFTAYYDCGDYALTVKDTCWIDEEVYQDLKPFI